MSALGPTVRRALVTGVAGFWGGSVAQVLEADPAVEVVVGVDSAEPTAALERTAFVHCDDDLSDLPRTLGALGIDTVVHAGLLVEETHSDARRIHEHNVIGTLNLLAACSAPAVTVRNLVVKSSALVYGAGPRDPNWFDERTERSSPARTRVERSLLDVEAQVASFVEERPETKVAVLRVADVVGARVATPLGRALGLPAIPKIFGFDPLLQLVDATDVVRAITFALEAGIEGTFNVAADDRLPWSELIALAGGVAWYLPPLFTHVALEPLAQLQILDLPPETLELLRYGRGLDNRLLKSHGFTYRATTAGAVRQLVSRPGAPRSGAAPRAAATTPRR